MALILTIHNGVGSRPTQTAMTRLDGVLDPTKQTHSLTLLRSAQAGSGRLQVGCRVRQVTPNNVVSYLHLLREHWAAGK